MNTNSKISLLAAWVLVCLGCSILSATANALECSEINRGKELRQLVQDHHVLVFLGEKLDDSDTNEDGDDDDAMDGEVADPQKEYNEICSRYSTTPKERVEDFRVVHIDKAKLQEKLLSQSVPPPPKDLIERWKQFLQGDAPAGIEVDEEGEVTSGLPSPFLLFEKGQTDASIPLKSIRIPPKDATTAAFADAEDVTNFIAHHLNRRKIGSFVYSLHAFDLIANQIVKYTNDDSLSEEKDPMQGYKAKFWYYTAKVLHQLHNISPSNPEFNTELTSNYIKVAEKIVVEQNSLYPTEQITRLESMLSNSGNQISELKKEKLQQRLYTLKRFSEPIDVSDEDVRSFVIQTILNVGIWILLIVLLFFVIFGTDEEEEEEEGDNNEQKENEDEKETKKGK